MVAQQVVWCLYEDGPPTDGSDVYSSPPNLFTSLGAALRYLKYVQIGEDIFARLYWFCHHEGYMEACDPQGWEQTIHLHQVTIDGDSVYGKGFPSVLVEIPRERLCITYADFCERINKEP